MSYVEEMVHCPYNVHHLILKSRFITHLCKCRKQNGTTDFSTCPFNATHSILTPELQYHIRVCPDRNALDSHIYVVANENKSECLNPTSIEVPTSENWDDEPQNNTSYLDVKDNLIVKRPILRLPTGKSRAQRKEFFAKEIERFEILSKGKVNGGATGMSSSFKEEDTQKLPPNDVSLGRGIRRKVINEEKINVKHTVDSDDEDFNNSIAVVLTNRGRGRGIPHIETQDS